MPPDAARLIDTLAAMIGNAPADAALIGIHTGGAWVADALAARLRVRDVGALGVDLHRDDLSRRGFKSAAATTIGFDVAGRDIILVDDVLQSGRTVRAALNELYDFGRPGRVRLAVLVDRGGRELPIAAEWTAFHLQLAVGQRLRLRKDAGGLHFDVTDESSSC